MTMIENNVRSDFVVVGHVGPFVLDDRPDPNTMVTIRCTNKSESNSDDVSEEAGLVLFEPVVYDETNFNVTRYMKVFVRKDRYNVTKLPEMRFRPNVDVKCQGERTVLPHADAIDVRNMEGGELTAKVPADDIPVIFKNDKYVESSYLESAQESDTNIQSYSAPLTSAVTAVKDHAGVRGITTINNETFHNCSATKNNNIDELCSTSQPTAVESKDGTNSLIDVIHHINTTNYNSDTTKWKVVGRIGPFKFEAPPPPNRAIWLRCVQKYDDDKPIMLDPPNGLIFDESNYTVASYMKVLAQHGDCEDCWENDEAVQSKLVCRNQNIVWSNTQGMWELVDGDINDLRERISAGDLKDNMKEASADEVAGNELYHTTLHKEVASSARWISTGHVGPFSLPQRPLSTETVTIRCCKKFDDDTDGTCDTTSTDVRFHPEEGIIFDDMNFTTASYMKIFARRDVIEKLSKEHDKLFRPYFDIECWAERRVGDHVMVEKLNRNRNIGKGYLDTPSSDEPSSSEEFAKKFQIRYLKDDGSKRGKKKGNQSIMDFTNKRLPSSLKLSTTVVLLMSCYILLTAFNRWWRLKKADDVYKELLRSGKKKKNVISACHLNKRPRKKSKGGRLTAVPCADDAGRETSKIKRNCFAASLLPSTIVPRFVTSLSRDELNKNMKVARVSKDNVTSPGAQSKLPAAKLEEEISLRNVPLKPLFAKGVTEMTSVKVEQPIITGKNIKEELRVESTDESLVTTSVSSLSSSSGHDDDIEDYQHGNVVDNECLSDEGKVKDMKMKKETGHKNAVGTVVLREENPNENDATSVGFDRRKLTSLNELNPQQSPVVNNNAINHTIESRQLKHATKDKLNTFMLHIEGILSEGCAGAARGALMQIKDIESASVDLSTSIVTIKSTSSQLNLCATVNALGCLGMTPFLLPTCVEEFNCNNGNDDDTVGVAVAASTTETKDVPTTQLFNPVIAPSTAPKRCTTNIRPPPGFPQHQRNDPPLKLMDELWHGTTPLRRRHCGTCGGESEGCNCVEGGGRELSLSHLCQRLETHLGGASLPSLDESFGKSSSPTQYQMGSKERTRSSRGEIESLRDLILGAAPLPADENCPEPWMSQSELGSLERLISDGEEFEVQ